MGRKTNPKILRITATSRTWDPKWFSDRTPQFRRLLGEDLAIRRYFAEKLRLASISRIEIARDQKETVLTVFTSRPAVVIGRGGSGIEQIQRDLKRHLAPDTRIRINVQEIRNPDTNAAAVATQVIEQLERRLPFRRVLKTAVSRAMQAGAVGARIAMAGRLGGAEIARREWLAEGNVPLHTFRADVDYVQTQALTSYGTIGIKVWINRGELVTEDEQPGAQRAPKQLVAARRSKRASLAEKAAKQRVDKPTKKKTAKKKAKPKS